VSFTALWPVLLLCILLAALALRTTGIGRESLDGDEAFSWQTAASDLPSLIGAVRSDLVHPPFYYLVLRCLIPAAGSDSVDLRIPSLLAGLAMLGVVGYYGHIFSSLQVPALFTAGLLAINNENIFYSQQIRSYALYAFLISLLMLWCWLIPRWQESLVFWCSGSILMTCVVYTHYVGAIYVACVVAAVLLSAAERKVKLLAFCAATLAAIAFLPWLTGEYSVYVQKNGLDANLSWQSTPSWYDLKAIWAAYVGIPDVPGGTTLVLAAALAVIAAGLWVARNTGSPLRTLFLWTSGLCAFAPPCLLFVLSRAPFSLPIFSPRHVLPSGVAFLLLLTDSAWILIQQVRFRTAALIACAAVLVSLQLVPTFRSLHHLPRRTPFSEIAASAGTGSKFYCTWLTGIGRPIYFHSRGRIGVIPLPASYHEVPRKLAVLFRRQIERENRQIEELIKNGWKIVHLQQYASGLGENVVSLASLERAAGE
jgi:hypothetical protein